MRNCSTPEQCTSGGSACSRPYAIVPSAANKRIYAILMGVNDNEKLFAWLSSMRGKRTVKILFGVRGIGKTTVFAKWRDMILADGFPEERLVCVNAEQQILRHLVTGDDVLRYLKTQFPETGPVLLLIEEPTSFPDYADLIGKLLANRRLDLYLALSSSRILTGELSDYLRGAISVYEMIPPPEGIEGTEEQTRARWNEIMLRDVLTSPGIVDVMIAERVAAYLADHVGDNISLRTIAAAISPPGRLFSPNTIEAYLTALERAHLIERCYRWDATHETALKSRYRVYFIDTALRTARFGFFPTDGERREEENRRYIALRRKHPHVYLPGKCDSTRCPEFITSDSTTNQKPVGEANAKASSRNGAQLNG